MAPSERIPPQITPIELFLTFSRLGLMGFGGVMPWVYREIVEKKKWLAPQEFAELLAMGQILPGANVTNLSAMLGYRFAGFRSLLLYERQRQVKNRKLTSMNGPGRRHLQLSKE